MLIPRATPSTSVWGAPGTGPIVARHSRTRTALPLFGFEVNRLSYRVSPLETRPRVLRRREASVVGNGTAGIGALPRAPPGRSRGLATSQTMDGSPSLRRRHRAAARSSWAGFLHTRPLVSSLYAAVKRGFSFIRKASPRGFVHPRTQRCIRLRSCPLRSLEQSSPVPVLGPPVATRTKERVPEQAR